VEPRDRVPEGLPSDTSRTTDLSSGECSGLQARRLRLESRRVSVAGTERRVRSVKEECLAKVILFGAGRCHECWLSSMRTIIASGIVEAKGETADHPSATGSVLIAALRLM
jgi:hypothetical protein